MSPLCTRAALPLLALLLLLAACRSASVPINQPLPLDAEGRPDFAANYGPALLTEANADDDLVLMLAFSGGGKRSAAFAHGFLRGLREVPVRRPGRPDRTLLDSVAYISGVSGGSFPAAHYGLYREQSFVSFEREFLNVDVNAYIYGAYLLPWNWEWLVNPFYGTNDRMALVYDQLMFRGASFADLQRRGPPLISINATDVVNETSFPFLGGVFGLLCSDLNSFPIARAIAASNGFPVLFSPITLQNRAADCRGQRPPLAPRAAWAEPRTALSRRAELARIANRYTDPSVTEWVHLMDGGVADNLALRALLDIFIAFGNDGPLVRGLAQRARRIVLVSVDGESAPDLSLGRKRIVTGIGQVIGLVSGAQIDAYNFETLLLAEAEVHDLARRLREQRCAQGRTVRGVACDDVQGALVHVALTEIEDPVLRARLDSIPTGLTIPAADVTALIEQGQSMARAHPLLRAAAAGQTLDQPDPNAPIRAAPQPPRR